MPRFLNGNNYIILMEQQTEIVMEAIRDVTLFDIKGDVTALSESPLNEAYEKTKAQGVNKIIMRFKKDAYINSGGIALLIQILAETKKNNQMAGITGLSDHFKKIFNMVGITKFADIFDTVEAALEAMSGSS